MLTISKTTLITFLFIITAPCYANDNQTFSTLVWGKAQPVIKRIKSHPFNIELLRGTLDSKMFKRYLIQDAIYLNTYGKLIQKLANQDKINGKILKRLVLSIQGEKSYKPKIQHARLLTFATYVYLQHLEEALKNNNSSIMLAAILPCQWVYFELYNHANSNEKFEENPYQNWLSSYISTDYKNITEQLIKLTNYYYQKADKSIRKEMINVFMLSMIDEYRFWDDVYNNNYLG